MELNLAHLQSHTPALNSENETLTYRFFEYYSTAIQVTRKYSVKQHMTREMFSCYIITISLVYVMFEGMSTFQK